MALSGLDIYKLLPKTNCRECGFVTCLAFAMQLAKKAVSIDKCPYISQGAKATLEAQSQPAIKLISIGSGENKIEVGNETVLFRHEEKFHHPCAVGFVLEDNLSDKEIKESLDKINALKFERVGQKLEVNLIAIKQTSNKEKFIKAVELVLNSTTLGLVLISDDLTALKPVLEISKTRKPLIFPSSAKNLFEIAKLCAEYKTPLVATNPDLEKLEQVTQELKAQSVSEIILDTGKKTIADKIWDLTQIRRQALKKSNRALGYPVLVMVEQTDSFEQVIEAAAYIVKYASIVLLKDFSNWSVLAALTLRQNIYTDPQRPLQIEPKIYPIGQVSDKSPVLVTTNFSLSYFTVLSEVEASKIPSYIITVDTEGMSVLTAWAAEKFNPEKIHQALDKFGLKDVVSHKELIIPGYVAMMSGDLEEKSGLKIIVGPKEAAGIPSFLKNLQNNGKI